MSVSRRIQSDNRRKQMELIRIDAWQPWLYYYQYSFNIRIDMAYQTVDIYGGITQSF